MTHFRTPDDFLFAKFPTNIENLGEIMPHRKGALRFVQSIQDYGWLIEAYVFRDPTRFMYLSGETSEDPAFRVGRMPIGSPIKVGAPYNPQMTWAYIFPRQALRYARESTETGFLFGWRSDASLEAKYTELEVDEHYDYNKIFKEMFGDWLRDPGAFFDEIRDGISPDDLSENSYYKNWYMMTLAAFNVISTLNFCCEYRLPFTTTCSVRVTRKTIEVRRDGTEHETEDDNIDIPGNYNLFYIPSLSYEKKSWYFISRNSNDEVVYHGEVMISKAALNDSVHFTAYSHCLGVDRVLESLKKYAEKAELWSLFDVNFSRTKIDKYNNSLELLEKRRFLVFDKINWSFPESGTEFSIPNSVIDEKLQEIRRKFDAGDETPGAYGDQIRFEISVGIVEFRVVVKPKDIICCNPMSPNS